MLILLPDVGRAVVWRVCRIARAVSGAISETDRRASGAVGAGSPDRWRVVVTVFWFLMGLLAAVLGVYFVIAAVLYWRDVRNRW